VERNRQHLLLELLVLAFCAVLCGADGWEDIQRFGLAKQDWLKDKLGLRLPFGIPSDDTFRRVFSRLDPEAFGRCFRQWTQTFRGVTTGEVIAVDGKTLRHSFDTACQQNPLHLVSAWAVGSRLVLGQVAVDDKSNEITAVPALLALLDLGGCVVTADAMSCQKAIAKQIIEQGGDYVLALKGNHPHLCEDVALCLSRLEAMPWPSRPVEQARQSDFGHGRTEERRCLCLPLSEQDEQWQDIQAQWPGLRSLVKVERRRKQADKAEQEVAYFLSSLPRDAARLSGIIRQHWQIENRLHWVLDVVMDEDACRIRKDHAPQNFAVLRHMALNQLRQEQSKGSIKGKQKRAGWDNDFLLKVLQC
jgi:predicted transposase YbfD/YdcC